MARCGVPLSLLMTSLVLIAQLTPGAARTRRSASCKACTDLVGKFQVCSGPQDCPLNTYCTTTGLGDGQQRCFPAKKPGGTCLEDRECLSGSYCNQPACGGIFDPVCFTYVCGAVSASAGISLAQAAGLSSGDVLPELGGLFQQTSRFG
ncbi:hypothetical protein FJT64_027640 [Amphibalanus amphitrite]|uniref:Dickkopf N-terminal cysteine-rich domain-containing protein n=1 Tax=Amphibalanus amphitrite TaxID=1232801 RepID=A0A6A4WCB5_AMPAM|nr:hypothetical protein FJT64_027640 [Amphibalanus amphitrite]